MRYFNTHGPVNAAEHYVVARRPLVEGLVAQIQQGKYLAISASRQMGKTTLLRALDAELDAHPDFLSIDLTFEAYESWSPADFWADFGEQLLVQYTAETGQPFWVNRAKAILTQEVA